MNSTSNMVVDGCSDNPLAAPTTKSDHAESLRIPNHLLSQQYTAVREQTLHICSPLADEDMMVQSCLEASPVKWHLAHTTWFFETFILAKYVSGYSAFNNDFLWLFNSYYNGVSHQPARQLRSVFSRPLARQIFDYRQYVDGAMLNLLSRPQSQELEALLMLGLNHEQQHQELILTDVKHAFWSNPLRPTYRFDLKDTVQTQPSKLTYIPFDGGIIEAGYSGTDFCFDNEQPRHRIWLEPFELASRPTTCKEFLEFMLDDGYSRPELWLSAGWDLVRAEGWTSPLYWFQDGEEWFVYNLSGTTPISKIAEAAVTHISHYEADAYARWAGMRLAKEAEWELAASNAIAGATNNFLESDYLASIPAPQDTKGVTHMFGNVWEWTESAYLGYPGYTPAPGALGEYNGKFMSGQMVLRGGSCATPASHIRATYRNFFPPQTRWQFSGIRLARYTR